MRQIRQVVYVLLYLHFFVRNVFTLDADVLSEEYSSDTNDVIWMSNWQCNETDHECTATGSICKDYECQCAPGYIFNSKMTSCLKVATRLNDSCEESVQCSDYLLSGGECVDNVCVCGLGYYYLHGRCYRYVGLFEKCERSVDCYVYADFEASTCNMTAKICECSPGFYLREYRTCRRQGNAVGDECMIDIDCNFENAICKDYVCVEKSKSNETIEFSTDIVLTDTMDKPKIRVGSDCTSDEQCQTELGNATCDPTGTCRCARAYFAPTEDAKCIPELGEPCDPDDEVGIEKSICRAGIWSCTIGTVASIDNHECRQATTEYGGHCDEDLDCYVFGPDAKCEENACECNTHSSRYIESEFFCWVKKDIGEDCVQNRDCYVEDFEGELVCKDGICGCPDNMQPNKNKTACIIVPAGIGDACVVDEDCITNDAICNDLELCECKETYYPSRNYRKCLAGVNATCEEDEECKPANSACFSEQCNCIENYVSPSVDKCLPILSFGELCLEDVQCSAKVPDAICAPVEQNAENKTCTCAKEDHYKFERCYKRKLLSETCTSNGECYLRVNQDSVMCLNGECTCDWGYAKWNSSVCLKDMRSRHFLNDGVIKVVSTGLFSIVLLFAFCDIL